MVKFGQNSANFAFRKDVVEVNRGGIQGGDPARAGESKSQKKRRGVGKGFEEMKGGSVGSGECEVFEVRKRGEGFWAEWWSVAM